LNTGAFETDPISVTNYPTYYFDTASFITAANPAVPASQLTQVSQRGAKNHDFFQIGLATPLISLGRI
jgi:hypothetical protein